MEKTAFTNTHNNYIEKRRQYYYKPLAICLIVLPLIAGVTNIPAGNYDAAILNICASLSFGILYILHQKNASWFFVLTGVLYQILVFGHAYFTLPGKHIELGLGLFTAVLPIFFQGRAFYYFFLSNFILFYLPWWSGYYENYFSLSYLLYIAMFILIRSFVKESEHYEMKLLEKQQKIEEHAQKLQEMDEVKSRFFANISHELRTPLTLILGPLRDMIGRKQLSNRDFTTAKIIEKNANQLLKRTNEILDLSRLENKALTLNEETTLFYPFLRRLLSQFESQAQMQNLHLIFKFQADHYLQLLLDRNKFEKIFNNFLSNALKFTSDGGMIEVSLQDQDNHLLLQVKDSGQGIPEEDLPYIFNRFYQSKTGREHYAGGSGIGLALCKELAAIFPNGKIWAESEVGKGSIFYFEFAKTEVMGAANTKEMIEMEKMQGQSIKKGPNGVLEFQSDRLEQATSASILIVEDNKSIQQYLQDILRNYPLKFASNGQEALNFLEKCPPDTLPNLIISDVMMPLMDGFELVQQLKATDKWCAIPLIMLTARADLKSKLKALRIGVDDYLLKPFYSEELLVRVNNILKKQSRNSPFVIDEVVENPTVLPSTNGTLSEQKTVSSQHSILIEDEENTVTPATIAPHDLAWLEQLEKIVQERLSDTFLNIEILAGEMHISRTHLFRKIKTLTQLTPNQYLMEARLQRARELLENKKVATVKEAHLSVGIKKAGYFSKKYRERFGRLPSEVLGGVG